ncbi:hypothetical protein [Aquirufa sp. OSTEICH-129A]
MLLKFYDLKKSDANCPRNPYLLQPANLHLTSYEILPNNIVKLSIGYSKTWSGYVTNTFRINYNQYVFGTLFYKDVEYVKEVEFNKKGSIAIPFFSSAKIVNLPILNQKNVQLKCKKIYVEDVDIYVKDSEGNFILNETYLETVRKNLENM